MTPGLDLMLCIGAFRISYWLCRIALALEKQAGIADNAASNRVARSGRN